MLRTERRRLPELSFEEFSGRLERISPEPLSTRARRALWVHYGLLREWGRSLSLIGPGTADEVVERHYGESLAGLPLIGSAAASLVDVGSGAGFPGLVVAAARPRLDVLLVESRQRKWAFLRTAVARTGLPCRCVNARVSAALPPDLPEEIDFLTLRAVKLPSASLAPLLGRLSPRGALLWWRTGPPPPLPAGYRAERSLVVPGSERRRIVEVRRHP